MYKINESIQTFVKYNLYLKNIMLQKYNINKKDEMETQKHLI